MIRPASAQDWPAVRQLVWGAFLAEIAPLLAEEGVASYRNFCSEKEMQARSDAGNRFLVLSKGAEVCAVAELRKGTHLVMLFVHPQHARQGLGSVLMAHSELRAVQTVSASPNAVDFYARHGFVATDAECEKNGLRFVPMARAGEQPR